LRGAARAGAGVHDLPAGVLIARHLPAFLRGLNHSGSAEQSLPLAVYRILTAGNTCVYVTRWARLWA